VEVMIESLRAFALSQETLTAASTIILATRHTALPATGNERVLVDADLAILGSPEVRYDRYAAGIRAEYAFVSDDDYRHGRRGVLEKFLAREQIFYTPIMAIEGEAAARSNLGRETANLA